MKFYNLQYYVDKLKRGEKFSLARYGDGELYCMWGRGGKNSNGCHYTLDLTRALLDSMYHNEDPTFIYGLQNILKEDKYRAINQYPEIDWHDSEIFGQAVADGKLYPLIEQLRKMKCVLIGNDSIRQVADILGCRFIEVPKSNAYDVKNKLFSEIYLGEEVFLFSCGMAANAFISELHGLDGWLLDLGHIWDPFVGNMSRCDLEGKTMEDINKNLKPWSDQ